MKFFNNNQTDGFNIVHLKGNKDDYNITESNGVLTYESISQGITYTVSNPELIHFKVPNIDGNDIFKWSDEINFFSSLLETTISFSSYASASTAFAPYTSFGLWRISNLAGSCGITINGDSSGLVGVGIAYGGRTITPSIEVWGNGPQIYYYSGSGAVSFTLEQLQ